MGAVGDVSGTLHRGQRLGRCWWLLLHHPWVPASSGWSSPVSSGRSGRRALPGQARLLQTGFAPSPGLGPAPRDPARASPPPVLLQTAPKAAASRPRSKFVPFRVTAGGLGQGLMKPELGGSWRKTSIRVRAFPTAHQQQEHHSRSMGSWPPPSLHCPLHWGMDPRIASISLPQTQPRARCGDHCLPAPARAAGPCLCCQHGAVLQRWGKTELKRVWGRLPGTDRRGGRVCSTAAPGGRRKSVPGAMHRALCKLRGPRRPLPAASSAIPALGERLGVGTGTNRTSGTPGTSERGQSDPDPAPPSLAFPRVFSTPAAFFLCPAAPFPSEAAAARGR